MRSFLLLLFISHALSQPAAYGSSLLQTELWSTSLSALKEHRSKTAIDLIERWITFSEKEGIKSTEAHYNLGVAYYQEKNLALANYHLLKSIQLQSSLFQSWQDLEVLTEIQKQLGIKDPITNKSSVKITLLSGTNSLLLLTVLGAWLFLIFLFLIWKKPPPYYFLLSLSLFLWLFAVLTYANHRYCGGFAVLNGHGNEVTLYKFSEKAQREELLTLPSGTLVTTGEEKNAFIQIFEPLSGWVNLSDIQMIESSPSFFIHL